MPLRIDAVLVPDVQFLSENGPELSAVLGVTLGAETPQAGRKQCDGGVLVHALRPGHESLGVRFFDWSRPEGKAYRVGTLLPAAATAEIVLGRAFGDDAGKAEALSSRVLINVEAFRKASGG